MKWQGECAPAVLTLHALYCRQHAAATAGIPHLEIMPVEAFTAACAACASRIVAAV